MSFYGDQIVPRLTDLTLRGRPYDSLRARVTADLRGEVLEIGFGSGRNVPYYPATVTRVCAVEPSAVGRKLAAGRVADSLVPVEFVGLDGEALPVDDASVDHVLTTWTLCTIPDVARALREVRRVLRRGGAFHFVEHGRAPDPPRGPLAGQAHADPASTGGWLPPQPPHRRAGGRIGPRARARRAPHGPRAANLHLHLRGRGHEPLTRHAWHRRRPVVPNEGDRWVLRPY